METASTPWDRPSLDVWKKDSHYNLLYSLNGLRRNTRHSSTHLRYAKYIFHEHGESKNLLHPFNSFRSPFCLHRAKFDRFECDSSAFHHSCIFCTLRWLRMVSWVGGWTGADAKEMSKKGQVPWVYRHTIDGKRHLEDFRVNTLNTWASLHGCWASGGRGEGSTRCISVKDISIRTRYQFKGGNVRSFYLKFCNFHVFR